MREFIYSRLEVGQIVSVNKVNSILANAIDHLCIPYKKEVRSSLLNNYFEFKNRRTKHERQIQITKKV